MSKNSQVRKIDLRANVDLANYRMDVHDYEGFCGCNSLFLNKRVQNWYTRSRGSSEVTGDLRIETNGDMFELWRDNTKLGEVSREYYKIESYNGETEGYANFSNPFPQGHERQYFFNSFSWGKPRSMGEVATTYIRKLSNGWFFVIDKNERKMDLYDSSENLIRTFSGEYYIGECFGYLSYGEIFRLEINDVGLLDGSIELKLKRNDIYFCACSGAGTARGEGFVYNIDTNTTRLDCTTVKLGGNTRVSDSLSRAVYSKVNATNRDGKQYSFCGGVNYTPYGFFVFGQQYSESYNNSYTKLMYGSSGYLFTTLISVETGDNAPTFDCRLSTQKDSYGEEKVDYYFTDGRNHNYSKTISVSSLEFFAEMHNYSYEIQGGNRVFFSINFINNVARNISHGYKKLINIDGNEDSEGYLTDIIDWSADSDFGYYIVVKKGGNYYKISFAYAESWEEVVTKVGSDYLIFNTMTYNNAYYIPGDKWFCSCDDWNNRLIWRVKDSTNFEGLVNSRLNQNWQTENYPVSVSDQNASIISRYAVTGLNMAAYPSSATWDGSSVVYDSSGNPVYTGGWAVGHSLNGYYYPLTWEINTSGMTPFYYDSNYTAPAGVAYDVFMADTSGGALDSLHKVGYADSEGFHSDPDSGTQFIDPSEGNYQLNCPLLDTTYLIFTTQAIAIIDNMSYILMNNVNMGNFVLLYREQDIATLTSDDRQFVINGSVYTYRAEAQRILDSNNRWVCDTHLFHYVGYSSRCAYFYCDFDKGLYAFSGDNTMNRLATVEKYNIRYSVGGDSAMLDTLNFPSLDLVLINLFTAVGVIYGDQFAVIDTGNITNWSIDDRRGLILINGVYYSLILANIQAGYTGEIGRLPIKIDTEYYGDPNNEDNTITDTVYLMVDNLNGVLNGNVKLRADVLQNNKVVKAEEKIFNLKSSDFNENIAQIKYQPKIQEGRGLKLYIESDYEISEMKFATAPGALNQTTKRI